MNDKNLLNYALLEKVLDDYEEIHRIDVKGLDYKEIKYLNKENKGDNDFNYYYEIKIDDKINTGIFRIGKNGNEKGHYRMLILMKNQIVIIT